MCHFGVISGMRSRWRCGVVGNMGWRVEEVTREGVSGSLRADRLGNKLRRGVRTSAILGCDRARENSAPAARLWPLRLAKRRHYESPSRNCTPKCLSRLSRRSQSLKYVKALRMHSPCPPTPAANNCTFTEWRWGFCPALQILNLPLLQLVGVLARHECLHQVIPSSFCQAQPSD